VRESTKEMMMATTNRISTPLGSGMAGMILPMTEPSEISEKPGVLLK
jgi:hypothetical protein